MLKRWMPKRVDEKRKEIIIREITEGSSPEPRFYFMVVISTLIAANGLVANSPAVIIGAMLVAPLMTPIFGIALAMVRTNGNLLARSLRAEIVGVAMSVLLGFLFGLIPLAIDPTTEMLSRTHPNLLDLCVAVLAGLAGSYAMVDERISPSLPGVAIATAIVPPLANSGLCLALGAYAGAMGSFMLFLANFFSILLASSFIFIFTSMHREFQMETPRKMLRKFWVAIVSFALIVVFFTFSLVELVQERYLTRTIHQVLAGKFSKIPGVDIEKILINHHPELLNVLATVQTPNALNPDKVRYYEEEISGMFNLKTKLIIRNVQAKDIAATGSTSQITAPDLDGDFIDESPSSTELKVMLAEQVLWEEFSHWPGFQVQGVDYQERMAGKFLLASIQCLYPPEARKVKGVETLIRERLGESDVQLIINSSVPVLTGSRGKILYEWTQTEEYTQANDAAREQIEQAVRRELGRFENLFLVDVHFRIKDGYWRILVEVAGTKVPEPQDLKEIREAVIARTGRELGMQIWFRNEVVVAEDGYQAYEDFIQEPLRENQQLILKRSSQQYP